MKKQRYYFLVTADEFELPVYIETSWSRLARASHIPVSALKTSYRRGSAVKKRFKIEVYDW